MLYKALGHDAEVSSRRKWETDLVYSISYAWLLLGEWGTLPGKSTLCHATLKKPSRKSLKELNGVIQHLKVVFALYHRSSSPSLQVYPAPKKLWPDSLLFGEKGTPASLLIPSSSSHCLHCRLCALHEYDQRVWTERGRFEVLCVFAYRRWLSVSYSTIWLRRMRTTRTSFAGTIVAEAGARWARDYISHHALWQLWKEGWRIPLMLAFVFELDYQFYTLKTGLLLSNVTTFKH